MSSEMEGKWFRIWYQDKQNILSTMYTNLAADIKAGYNPFGECVTKQRRTIQEYIDRFDEEMEHIKEKNKQQTEHWCYYDLLKRGAIT